MGKKRIIKQTKEELLKEGEAVASKKEIKVGAFREIQEGRIYIASSYNNTIITLTDSQGGVLAWASAGSIGFKGTKKSTPFAASRVVEAITQAAQKLGVQRITVLVKGVGAGRESAIRSLAAKGFDIVSVADVTPIPHDGCRPRKARRV